MLRNDSLNDLTWILKTLFGIFIVFNIVFNYLSAVFVKPGDTALFTNEKYGNMIESNNDAMQTLIEKQNNDKKGISHTAKHAAIKNNPHTWRYCQTCDRIKPPRTHHCSICGK